MGRRGRSKLLLALVMACVIAGRATALSPAAQTPDVLQDANPNTIEGLKGQTPAVEVRQGTPQLNRSPRRPPQRR